MTDENRESGMDQPRTERGAGASDALFGKVYEDLRQVAALYLGRETPAHTLQPTALVHEAYLRLDANVAANIQDAVHFRAIASRAMRLVLIDHARKRGAQKRGGNRARLTLTTRMTPGAPTQTIDLLELEEGLKHLESRDPRLARIVELRFFGGLTVEEVAREQAISATVVKEDWRLARAMLTNFIGPAT